jgi:hypothetical protein
VRPYALAPAPAQLYPDHHPSLNPEEAAPAVAKDEPAKTYQRKNASEGAGNGGSPGVQLRKADEVLQDGTGTVRRRGKETSPSDDEGGIRNFAF